MPEEEPDNLAAQLEKLKQMPGYQNPRVKALLDERFPELKALHEAGNKTALVQALYEIEKQVKDIVEPPNEAADDDEEYLLPALDRSVKDSFEGLEDSEIVKNLQEQYWQRLVTLRYFNIIGDIHHPAITDINNQTRHFPEFQEIQEKLLTPEFLQKIKQFKHPMLLVTPIGMSLKELAQKVGGKCGRLAKHDPVRSNCDLDADKNGHLVYFPEQYNAQNHGGITKAELLAQSGGKNIFPGWQVTVVEGTDEIDKEAIKINPPPIDPVATKYKGAHRFLQEVKTGGLSGFTPEEWLVLHAEGVRRGKPFENKCRTWLLAAYHKALHTVMAPSFHSLYANADLRSVSPGMRKKTSVCAARQGGNFFLCHLTNKIR